MCFSSESNSFFREAQNGLRIGCPLSTFSSSSATLVAMKLFYLVGTRGTSTQQGFLRLALYTRDNLHPQAYPIRTNRADNATPGRAQACNTSLLTKWHGHKVSVINMPPCISHICTIRRKASEMIQLRLRSNRHWQGVGESAAVAGLTHPPRTHQPHHRSAPIPFCRGVEVGSPTQHFFPVQYGPAGSVRGNRQQGWLRASYTTAWQQKSSSLTGLTDPRPVLTPPSLVGAWWCRTDPPRTHLSPQCYPMPGPWYAPSPKRVLEKMIRFSQSNQHGGKW